jgi:(1->4)-alpha-D-glucan 1-alpha-D-glucosylmutase
VPDLYQGDELLSLNLVDPDNRRPVDWELRRRLLGELTSGAPPRRETEKLFVIWRTLALRARRPEAFSAAYEPLDAGGGLCAFTRGSDVLVAVPTRPGARFEPPAGYREVLDGAGLGVTLLERA